MSTGYYAAARYGFADTFTYGPDSTLPDIPGIEDDEEGAGNKWLEANGLNLLRFDPGGNQVSGPERWAIVVKDLGVRASKWDEPEAITHLGAVSTAANIQLAEARRLLERADLTIGWMFLWDVS